MHHSSYICVPVADMTAAMIADITDEFVRDMVQAGVDNGATEPFILSDEVVGSLFDGYERKPYTGWQS